jgi:hypothetical protein
MHMQQAKVGRQVDVAYGLKAKKTSVRESIVEGYVF